MKYGLKDNFISTIEEIFKKNNKITKLIIYGSRAKGTYKLGSDIDLAIVGDISLEELNKIAIELDDLDSPYTFDLCIYNKLKNVALKEEIDKVGQIMLNRFNS